MAGFDNATDGCDTTGGVAGFSEDRALLVGVLAGTPKFRDGTADGFSSGTANKYLSFNKSTFLHFYFCLSLFYSFKYSKKERNTKNF